MRLVFRGDWVNNRGEVKISGSEISGADSACLEFVTAQATDRRSTSVSYSTAPIQFNTGSGLPGTERKGD
jgi:hypothetical protein